ncbi:MAG: CRISPR-associated endonuclease Cas1, partial [Prevotellaceae bacterium]|nr:CRISPR-associated endonuclease Cas1 [Prevotellaceae bacterium]
MDLVLQTYGTALTRDNEAFVVLHKDGKQRIPPADVNSILISRGAQISSDAVLLAIENEIEVLFLEQGGKPAGRIWSNKYGSISTIRKGQLTFAKSKEAVRWITEMIAVKLENQQALLWTFAASQPELNDSVQKSVLRLENYRKKVKDLQGDMVSDIAAQLRGWEGIVSKIY